MPKFPKHVGLRISSLGATLGDVDMGLGFRVWGVGFGFRVQGLGFRVQG